MAVPFVQAPADAPLPSAGIGGGQVDLGLPHHRRVSEEDAGREVGAAEADHVRGRAQISPAGPTDRGSPHGGTTAPCSSWPTTALNRRTSSGSVQVCPSPTGVQIWSRTAWSQVGR